MASTEAPVEPNTSMPVSVNHLLQVQAAVPSALTVFDIDGFLDNELRERVRTLGTRIVQYAFIKPNSSKAVLMEEV